MAGASLPRRKQRPSVLEATTAPPSSTPASHDPPTSSEAATSASPQKKDALPIDVYEPCVASVEGWAALGTRCLTIAEDEVIPEKKLQREDGDCRREETSAISSEIVDLSLVDGVLADSPSKLSPLTGTTAITADGAPGSIPHAAETAMPERDSLGHSPRQQESENAAPDEPLSDKAKESDSITNANETASLIPGPETCPLLTSPSVPSAHVVTTAHFQDIVGSLPQKESTSSAPAAPEGEPSSSSLYGMPVITSSCRALSDPDDRVEQHDAQPLLVVQAGSQYADERSAEPEVSADDLKLAFSNNAAAQGVCDAWPASETVCLEEEEPTRRRPIQQQTPEDTDRSSLQSHSQPSTMTAERPEPAACSHGDAVKTTRTIRLKSLRLRQVDSGKTTPLPLSAESNEECEHRGTNHVLLPTDSASIGKNLTPEEGSNADSGEFKVMWQL